MNNENMFEILERNNINIAGLACDMYREFLKELSEEREIIEKIKEYEEYLKNNNNKYSEDIMKNFKREGRIK